MQKNTYVKTVETVNRNSLDNKKGINLNINIKNKKAPNGITLITLVITIIVLLILAGVAIATLTGENGLLNKAQNARDETKKSQATETMNLKITNIQISSYFDTSKDVLEENKELSKDNARSKDHIIRRYDMMEG